MKIRILQPVAFIILSLIVPVHKVSAQHYRPAVKGSKLEFNSKLHSLLFKAAFTDFTGSIIFDPVKLKDASFDIEVKAKSLQGGNTKTNNELKNNLFNVDKYPVITIRSDSVFRDRPGSAVYQVQSRITIKGITKPVKMQLIAIPSGSGYLFRGSFSITGMEFNICNNGDMSDLLIFFIEIKAVSAN